MKVCEQGHQNADDADRCAQCFQSLAPQPAVSLDLWVPEPIPTVVAGRAASMIVHVRVRGADHAAFSVSVDGDLATLLPAEEMQRTIAGGPQVQVAFHVAVGDEATAGTRTGLVTATPISPAGPSATTALAISVVPAAPVQDRTPPPRPPDTRTRHLARVEPDEEPAPVVHDADPRDGRHEPPAPRTWRRVSLGTVTLVAVVLLALVAWLVWPRDFTPEEAFRLSAQQAADELLTLVDDDADEVARVASDSRFVTQLSSKCRGLNGDLMAAMDTSTLGFPDGNVETPSMTEADILAFHLGLVERWGDGVLLTTRQRLSPTPIRVCPDASAHWYSLLADEATTWGDGRSAAEQWCRDRFAAAPNECGVFNTVRGRTVFP